MSVDCPKCGAEIEAGGAAAPPVAPTSPGDLSQVLALLQQIAHWLAPLVPALYQNWSAAKGTLPNSTLPNAIIPIQLSQYIPAGCRSILMRNLSPTKPITYAYINSSSPPSGNFQTLPANQPLALDAIPPALSVFLDNTNADAGFEVTFFQ